MRILRIVVVFITTFLIATNLVAATWSKLATIPVVVAGASCNSTTQRIGVTSGNVILSCQSGSWQRAAKQAAITCPAGQSLYAIDGNGTFACRANTASTVAGLVYNGPLGGCGAGGSFLGYVFDYNGNQVSLCVK